MAARVAVAVAAVCAAACAKPVPIEGARCDAVHRCPKGYACAGGACRALGDGPTTRCRRDADCAVGVCLEERGFCVQCAADGDCLQGVCLPGYYQCGCERDDQCLTGRCHAARHACLACFSDAQCASGRCDLDDGVCAKNPDDRGPGAEGTGDASPDAAEEDG